jgi:hypothetical protein
MKIGTTFFAVVYVWRLILTHDTYTRSMLPYITALTANHEPGVLDIGVRKGVLLTSTDTSRYFCRAVIFVFIVGRRRCRWLLRC